MKLLDSIKKLQIQAGPTILPPSRPFPDCSLRVADFDRRRAAFVPGWPTGRPCWKKAERYTGMCAGEPPRRIPGVHATRPARRVRRIMYAHMLFSLNNLQQSTVTPLPAKSPVSSQPHVSSCSSVAICLLELVFAVRLFFRG